MGRNAVSGWKTHVIPSEERAKGIYGLLRNRYGECHRIERDDEPLEERFALRQQLDLLCTLLRLGFALGDVTGCVSARLTPQTH